MPRLDLLAVFRRAKSPSEAYAHRDAALVEWSKADGYKALLDMYEREMRAVFMAWLVEKDPAKLEEKRALGRAIHTLIRRVDERAATVQAAETMQEFTKRVVADMATDRAELAALDRSIMERAMQAPDPQMPLPKPAMQPVY